MTILFILLLLAAIGLAIAFGGVRKRPRQPRRKRDDSLIIPADTSNTGSVATQGEGDFNGGGGDFGGGGASGDWSGSVSEGSSSGEGGGDGGGD